MKNILENDYIYDKIEKHSNMNATKLLPANLSVTKVLIVPVLFLLAQSCAKTEHNSTSTPVIVMETKDGYISNGEIREYPQIILQIQSDQDTTPWDVCIRHSDSFDTVHGHLSPNENNVFVLERDSFTKGGDHQLTVTISKQEEDGLVIRRNACYTVVDSELKRPQGSLAIDGVPVSQKETFVFDVGTHECRFVCDIEGDATLSYTCNAPEDALSVTLVEKETSLLGTLVAESPVSAMVTFTVTSKEDSWDYVYSLQVKDNSLPVELSFHPTSDIVFIPDVFTLSGEVKGLIPGKNTVEFFFDNKAIEPINLNGGEFLLEVPSVGTSAGEHSVKGRIVSVATGDVLIETSHSFSVCGFEPRLYEKSSGQENWNRNARVGLGLIHMLDIELGTDATLEAILSNTTNNQTVTGYQTTDKSHVLFQLTDREIARGPQTLSVKLIKEDETVAVRTVEITGWHVYTCRYSIANNAVYSNLSGPKRSFAFPVHFSISIYLQGVIPYTEAIEIGGGHYDKECFEYSDIESMGITYDLAANETFSNREIYSSSYFKYASSYLSGELNKIHPSHNATRWVQNGDTWTKESYWPTPYLQANIIFGTRRTDGLPFEDYFEVAYDSDSIRQWLSQYDVRMVTYLAF